jgi:hypothetical protein
MLLRVRVLLLIVCLLSTPSAASTGAPRIAKFAPTAFQRYIESPTADQARWMREHYARMLVFSPYFDARLSWHPNGWVYKDLYAIYVGSAVAAAHPEWILRDDRGRELYIPFDCSGGACPQFAGDVGNPAFRADWIDTAAATMAEGYVGLFVDDVNMLISRVSDGHANPVAPRDPRTGTTMTETDWRRYMAEFAEQIRAAFPAKEIVHNALWFVPTSDEYVQRQLEAADVITLERGFNDAGIANGRGTYGFETLLGVIDWLHERGRGVWLDSKVTSNTEREYGLAAYLLTTTGRDYIGNTPGAEWDDWWRGYDVDLGEPMGPRAHAVVFQREFQDGRVLVNQPGFHPVTVHLGGRFLRVNGTPVISVTLGPGQGAVLRRADPPATPAPPTCPVDGGRPDADGDRLPDACDPCTNVVPTTIRRAKLSFARLLEPPGTHRLRFEGSFANVPLVPAIDPVARGVRVLIGDHTATARVDVTITGGAFDPATHAGWRVDLAGNAWTYSNPGTVNPPPNGIRKVRLRRTAAGRIRFRVDGRNGHYPIEDATLPLVGTLVLDSPAATTGQCGEATFPASGPDRYSCRIRGGGDTIRCQ